MTARTSSMRSSKVGMPLTRSESPVPRLSKINVASKLLSKLELGTAKIYLVRKQSKAEQKPNLVILAETEFYTNEKDILITP